MNGCVCDQGYSKFKLMWQEGESLIVKRYLKCAGASFYLHSLRANVSVPLLVPQKNCQWHFATATAFDAWTLSEQGIAFVCKSGIAIRDFEETLVYRAAVSRPRNNHTAYD